VAIVQISQITNRKGLQENLPQLAGAELGWSTDSRRLFIGNGTIEDGAPVIGNTEILTEFSDILGFTNTYTYKGLAAGYQVQTGPTLGTPVTQSLQSWLDQYASVQDFGAVGDGSTDDTEAINRALYQIYCREVNPQIRRSLYFPAGVYRVTSSINIPPYATLYGEGNNNSIIAMDNDVADYVARTADSLQQIGNNIGNAGATPPQDITITNMGFTHLDPTGSVFLVEDATNMTFKNVGIRGVGTTADLTSDANGSIGIALQSNVSYTCEQIVFDGCVFSGLVYALYSDYRTKGVTVTNSFLNILYQGILLGEGSTVDGGPTGTRITENVFDNIFAEGIVFGRYLSTALNASGHNVFYDVGNGFSGSNVTPVTVNISIESNNNVSIGDMFERNDATAQVYPRISLINPNNSETTLSIATTNGESLQMGQYTRLSGTQFVLINDDSGPVFTFDCSTIKCFKIDYTIIRDINYRTGFILVASDGGTPSALTFTDTQVENATTGITLSMSQSGTDVSLDYIADNYGVNGTIYYSITYLA
jgi:hypothetical protein